MANHCEYDAHFKGTRASVKKIIDWLQANYDYTNGHEKVWKGNEENPEPVEHHIGFKVLSCHIDEPDILEGENDEEIVAAVYGYVAWSIESMLQDNEAIFSISLPEACQILNIEAEIFSKEPGEGFAEHYLINKNRSYSIYEDTSYDIAWISDYKTYEDFAEDNGSEITKNVFEQAQKEGTAYFELYGTYPSGAKQYKYSF